jgi:C_GCAxxG_C_C family probable redox protein
MSNLLYKDREATLKKMNERFMAGHHCSEVVFAELGQYYDRTFDPTLIRLGTGFGGGIAQCADVCGALAGGVMLIGYLYGRTSLAESNKRCWEYCKLFRERFLSQLGGTSCYHFTQGQFNPANHEKCAEVVAEAARILLDLLPEP